MNWLLIGCGGFVGTCLRYALSRAGSVLAPSAWWPWGTFAANALGSFGLALVFVACEGRSIFGVDARLVLGTGVMGGFTTYSTYNLEMLRLALEGQGLRALIYLGTTVVVCAFAGALGLALARAFSS